MSRLRYLLPLASVFSLVMIVGTTTLGTGGSKPVEAHGVVDQSQTTSTTVGFNGSAPMGQSFKPTSSTLVAVDVKGEWFGSDDPNAVWTVAIKRGYQTGPIIALKTMTGAFAAETVYHIDFPAPISVTPGTDYWIEVGAEGNLFQWSIVLSGNPYANGHPDSTFTSAYPDGERYFVTYASPPPPSVTPTRAPTRTPRL